MYERAKEMKLLVIPNKEIHIRRLKPMENLLTIVCKVHGEDGFLKLKEFADEFKRRDQDARLFVV